MKEFWKEKTLQEMTDKEWESLCDGCGKCCLIKLRDDKTDKICFTDIACRQLNTNTCQCKDYTNRFKIVPECIDLRKHFDETITIMPETCAYRLLYEGKELYDWHYLISGDCESVHRENISAKDRVTNDTGQGRLELLHHIIDWA